MLCLRIDLMLMLMSLVSTKLYAWFPSSGYVCYVFDTKPLPTWQTITNYQSEFTSHDRLQKSERFARYGHIGSSNVSKQCKLFARVVCRRNT